MTYVPARIDLGSVVCNTGIPDANGVLWYCEIPEGWDSPEQSGGTVDPTGRDGSASLPSFMRGRQLTAPGMAIAQTSAAAWQAYYTVMGSLPGIRGTMDLAVHEPTPKKLTVVQQGPPRAKPPRWTYQFTWQLSLRADFPLKVLLDSSAVTTPLGASSSTTITNNGTTGAYPVVTVTSSGTVDLVIGGRHFTTSSLASGVYIDMWARTIRDSSGNDVTPWPKDPASEWLAIPPGSPSVQQAGTAALSIVTSDTYA